jgi:hypothetical protein
MPAVRCTIRLRDPCSHKLHDVGDLQLPRKRFGTRTSAAPCARSSPKLRLGRATDTARSLCTMFLHGVTN